MTEAGSAAGSDARPGWQWDVALSFASAQRPYVEQVARALRAWGVRCFYDADEQIELWGKYLAEELPAIYGEQAASVVVFVSAEYAARDWTRLERRTALNRAVRERREYVLPARFDDTSLPGLLSDMVAVDLHGRSPEQFAAMIADKLARLAIIASAPSAGAGNPARDVEPARPPGAVRAGDADLRRLGVHAAISVPGVPDDVLPEYVPRDADAAGSGVRARVAAAAERGGFVLLVGGSSVGKTRCAAEAVRVVLPDWWLVHPSGPDQVAALAQVPSPRTVVWLNELQDYLDGEHGLTAAVVRALLNHPAVIIGTLWPERYAAYTTEPEPGAADPHRQERQVLDLADVVRIAPAFSEAEQGRARVAAARDPRLRVALESAGYGLTQTLAAAPQLVARWEDAQTASPYAWAVLTAALDMARLGARAPLSADLLRAAAPGYCTSQQQAEAPDNWFERALAYATAKLYGAAAALSPVGSGMGQVAGYTVADYLERLGRTEREKKLPPPSFWAAAGDQLPAAALPGLASQARSRGMYRTAAGLLKDSLRKGVETGAADLLSLLAKVDPASLDEAAQWLLSTLPTVHLATAQRLVGTLLDHGRVEAAKHVRQRAANTASLHDPGAVADFLTRPNFLTRSGLLSGWDDEAITTALLARDPAAQVALTDVYGIRQLIRRFTAVGARAQVAHLARRLAAEADYVRIVELLIEVGAHEQAADAAARLTRLAGDAVSSIDVGDPGIASVLWDLHSIGATELIDELLRRDPAGRADLDGTKSWFLLPALAGVGAGKQTARLLERIRAHALTAPPDWTADLYGMALELRFDDELVAQLPVPDFAALFGLDVSWTPMVRVLAMRPSPGALDELVDHLTAAAPGAHQNPGLLVVLDALAEVDAERLARPLAALAAAPLTNPEVVAWLLDRLADREGGGVADLLARDPAGTVDLTDPEGLVALLTALDQLGRHDQVTALLGRDPFNYVAVTSPTAVTAMCEATAGLVSPTRLTVLATRAGRDTDVSDLAGVVRLLQCMLTIDAGEPATALALRAVEHADRWTATDLLQFLEVVGHPALASVRHHLVAHAVAALATNDLSPGHHRRAPALLRALYEVGAGELAVALANRVADEVDLDRPGTCAQWAKAMRDLGAQDAADALSLRAANAGHFDLYLKISPEQARTYAFGREPDGRPASPWGWRDLQ